MEIDWTVVTLLIVSFMAINGFFKGWWREAVITVVITGLIFLLQNPDLAESVVNLVNQGLAAVSGIINQIFGAIPTSNGEPFQLQPSDPATWFILLFLLLGGASLLARLVLPAGGIGGQYYGVSFLGRTLGFVLGAINGFLLLGIAREYLDGRSLPGTVIPGTVTTADATILSSNTYGPAASTVAIQATGLPDFTILDSALPWIIIILGAIVLIAAINSRVGVASRSGEGWKIDSRLPYGYHRIDIK